jgi:hypothetical protein
MDLDKLTINQLKLLIVDFLGNGSVPKGTKKSIFVDFIKSHIDEGKISEYLSRLESDKPSGKKTKAKKSSSSRQAQLDGVVSSGSVVSESRGHVFVFTEEMYLDLVKRIADLEAVMKSQVLQTNAFVEYSNKRKISNEDILSKIESFNNNSDVGKWVRIDWLYDDLKVYGDDRSELDEQIIQLYYKELIDLAEGGDSTYRIKVRGTEFGRISLRK